MISEFDRAKYLPTPTAAKATIVDRADEAVDIREILRDMNKWTPDGDFYSYKIDCPWSAEHADGGMDKNCRLYGGTNIYCFAMHGRITPTILYSKWRGISRQDAALELLDARGLLKKNWRETWQDLMTEREKEHGFGNSAEAVAALHSALDNDLIYKLHEFDARVRVVWTKHLALLDTLMADSNAGLSQLVDWFSLALTELKQAARLSSDS